MWWMCRIHVYKIDIFIFMQIFMSVVQRSICTHKICLIQKNAESYFWYVMNKENVYLLMYARKWF